MSHRLNLAANACEIAMRNFLTENRIECGMGEYTVLTSASTKKLSDSVNECESQKIVIMCGIDVSERKNIDIGNHANWMLIDKKEKTLLRFEPHGVDCASKLSKLKSDEIYNTLSSSLGLTYKFYNKCTKDVQTVHETCRTISTYLLMMHLVVCIEII